MKRGKLILAVAMLLSMANGWAQSGTCGVNLTWVLSDSTLTISGSGAMKMDNYNDYFFYGVPWHSYRHSITAVIIENGVTTIGDYAFYGCIGLTAVTIPNSVTTIGDYAFFLCSNLSSITIPNSVTTIGNEAFAGCFGLTSINVDDNNPHYLSENGILFNKSKTTLIQYPAEKIDVAYIIPNSVTTIGDWAFYYCFNLSTVTIPNSVTTIEKRAFAGCTDLTAVTIPNSVKTIGDEAFAYCIGLTSVTIPNSVTTLGNEAFSNCSGLSTVIISNSVTTIGTYTFAYCDGLTAVTIPNSVTTIEERAFADCTGLTAVTIPNGVTTIEKQAFYGCIGLTSVTIPNSVTAIGDYAFFDCRSLIAIDVDDSNKNYSSENGVLFNKSKTILIQYPAAKTDVTYNIPDIVTAIGDWAFVRCYGLTAVTIPNSVTTIGDRAFWGCSDLTSITIFNSVTTIGNGAFGGCGLSSVTIPNSVTTLGNDVFYGCTDLKEVTVAWITPLDLSDNIFEGINTSVATLRVPLGTKALYQTATVCKDFGTIVEYNSNGNENIQTPTLTAYASNGILHINGIQPDKPLHIYNLSGQLIYKGIAKAAQESVPVAARGIYIVTAGGQTVKVINN